MREAKTYSMEIAGREMTIEAGRFAEQASGACSVRYGDTIILAAMVAAKEPREGADFRRYDQDLSFVGRGG